MIFCFTHRLLSYSVIIREASSGIRGEQVHRPTVKHSCRVSKPEFSIRSLHKRRQGKTAGIGGDRKYQKNMAQANQLSRIHAGSQRIKLQIQACMGLYQVLCTYVMAVSLMFYETPNR